MRSPNLPPHRRYDDRSVRHYRLLGNRQELALGITLMILVTISGQEIAHLVSPLAAIIVMALACCAGAVAYERAT